MLSTYQTRTAQLLQNPSSAATQLYQTSDINIWINIARGQIAGASECIRVYGSLSLTTGTQVYPFSAINVSTIAGVAGVLHTRGSVIGVASGGLWLHPRPFPYFQLYFLSIPVPAQAQPVEYSQYGQGAGGSIYFNPVPDQNYTVSLDCVCYPINLVDDTTPEALVYPWTDCVAYFAAYLALMSAQRVSDADHMWQQYQTFMALARSMSNGDVSPSQYIQSGDPTRSNKLGVSPKGGG